MIAEGEFGYPKVNVTAQRRDAHSLLSWMERALHTLRECPEFAIGSFEPLDTKERSVVALRYEAPSGVMLALTNLADEPCVVDLADQLGDLPDHRPRCSATATTATRAPTPRSWSSTATATGGSA